MEYRQSFRFIALLVVFAICSCSGGQYHPAVQESTPIVESIPSPSGLPLPVGLDIPVSLKGVSATQTMAGYSYVDQDSFNSLTSNAEGPVGLQSLRLIPNATEYAYAIYGVQLKYNNRIAPFLAPMEMKVKTGGNNAYWVGLFDFQTTQWRFAPGPLSGAENVVKVGLTSNAGDIEGAYWFVVVADRSELPAPEVTINSFDLEFPDPPLIGQDFLEYSEFITAADDTRLATNIFLPLENDFIPSPPGPPFPVVLFRTPYDIDIIHDSRFEFGGVERSLPSWLSELNVVLVTQYFRGRLDDTGAWPDSEGTESLFRDHAGPDNFDSIDTVKWIENRAFYNESLVLTGPSALGMWIYQASTQLGDRVSGIYPQVSCGDIGDWAAQSNGCFKRGNVEGWLTGNDYPPSLLQEAYDQFGNDTYWQAVDFDTQASGVNCPGYHETGWWDVDVSATIDSWKAFNTSGGLLAAANQRLIIGPWSHETMRTAVTGEITFPTAPDDNNSTALPPSYEGLLWALNLLGRNPLFFAPEDPVLVYFMGDEGNVTGLNNKWETLADWPPPSVPQTHFLTAVGGMSDIPEPVDGFLGVENNPMLPVDTLGGEMLPVGVTPGPADQSPLYTTTHIRSFRTDPLAQSLTIAGEIQFEIYVSTLANDTDFMVKLIDEYPAGDDRHMLVCDNAVRMSHAVGSIAQATVYQVNLKLGDRAYVFEAGHKIGIDIQSSNFPRFDINPGSGDRFLESDGSNGVVQSNKVHFGPDNTTKLILPVYTP